MSLVWRLAFRNLWRNPRRSFTTGMAILAGFVGLTLLSGYILRVREGLKASTVYINLQGHVQIHKLGGLERFAVTPKKYLIQPELDQALEKILATDEDDIQFQGKFLSGSGLIIADNLSQPFIARGAEAQVVELANHHPTVQTWARGWNKITERTLSAENLHNPQMISITKRMGQIIGRLKAGQDDFTTLTSEQKNVQLVTRTFANDMNAVNAELGMMHTTGVALAEDTSLRAPLAMIQELMATDGYEYRAIFLKKPEMAFRFIDRVKRQIQEQKLPLEVFHFTEGSIGELYTGTMNFFFVMGSFFVALISGMVALSIVNSLTLGILERTREIGTLKALGFSRNQIVGLFVRETLWLVGLSLSLGLVISLVACSVINAAGIRFSPPGVEGEVNFELSADVTVFLLLAVVLSVIALATSALVSRGRLKKSAIGLLSDQGV